MISRRPQIAQLLSLEMEMKLVVNGLEAGVECSLQLMSFFALLRRMFYMKNYCVST